MTEAEWLACSGEDTGDMQDCLRRVRNVRKLRLFACACCRHIEGLMSDPRSRRALEVAERHVEETVSDLELEDAWLHADRAADEIDQQFSENEQPGQVELERTYYAALAPHWAAIYSDTLAGTIDSTCHAAFYAQRASNIGKERSWQARALCDILGVSEPLPSSHPDWLTSTVTALARGIYDERAFERMPILADALQDAGCDHPDILDHCRDDGPHVRGCWVVDLLLGKE